jgi:hypothetical protein
VLQYENLSGCMKNRFTYFTHETLERAHLDAQDAVRDRVDVNTYVKVYKSSHMVVHNVAMHSASGMGYSAIREFVNQSL